MKTILPVLFFTIFCFSFASRAADAPPPPPDVDFSADVTVGCQTLTANFSDDIFIYPPYIIATYTWDFGDGTVLTDTTEAYPSHTYLAPGVYDVTMSVTYTNGETGSLTKSAYITVGSNFSVDLGPDVSGCTGTPVNLNASTVNASAYLWSQGSTTAAISTLLSGNISVIVTRDGCQAKDTVTITRSPSLTADFTHDSIGGCSPIKTNFTQTSSACGGSIVSYSWDFGDASTSTAANPSHDYLSPGTYTVSLTVTKNDATTFTVTKSVIVGGYQTPIVELGPDQTLCDGSSLTLSGGNTGATILWSTGETTEDILIFDEALYTVSVTKNGCTVKDSIYITTKPELNLSFGFTKLNSCLPTDVQFTDSSTACTGVIAGWLWDFGDGTPTSTATNPLHTYLKSGTFPVRLKLTAQSGSTSIKTIPIVIPPGPLSVNLGNDTTICDGETLTLDAGNPGSTYSWNTGESDQQIVAYDPGQYIVVVDSSGCLATDTVNVAFGISAVSNWGYTIGGNCLPATVNFSDSSVSYCGQAITGWQWNFGDGATSTQQNPVHIYTTAGSFNATLTVTAANGNTASRVKNITIVKGSLSVDLGKDTTICFGESLILDAANPGATYSWSTGESTQQIEVFDNGQYFVSVDSSGCKATDTINVTVGISAVSNWGYTFGASCLPASVTFSDSSVSYCGQAIVGWKWIFGDGTTSTQQNPVHIYTAAGSYPVTLMVTAANGNTASKAKNVTVVKGPLSVKLGNDTTICLGESLILDAANPGAIYSWSTGENTQQIEVFDDGQYAVSIDSSGCIATDTINVTVGASAVSNWGYAVSGNCLPVTVSFSDSSTSYCGQAIVGWKWDFGDGTTSTQRNPVHIYTTADSFVVKLTVTAGNGNTGSRTRKVIISNNVFNVDLPSVMTVCRGGSATLDAVVTGAQYAWTPVNGLSAANIRNPIVSPSVNGYYKVTVTKCSISLSDSVYIKLDSIAKPVVTQNGNVLSSTNAVTYQWYMDGVAINGGVTQTYTPTKAGSYTVKAANSLGCSNLSAAFFYVPLSPGEEPADKFRIKITPNPSSGVFDVLFAGIPSRAARVYVYDAAGKHILTTTMQDHVNRMDLSRFQKGVYFVQIIINSDRKIFTVVVQ